MGKNFEGRRNKGVVFMHIELCYIITGRKDFYKKGIQHTYRATEAPRFLVMHCTLSKNKDFATCIMKSAKYIAVFFSFYSHFKK